MTIEYADSQDFHDGIAALVRRGLTFKADHARLIITLTGGF